MNKHDAAPTIVKKIAIFPISGRIFEVYVGLNALIISPMNIATAGIKIPAIAADNVAINLINFSLGVKYLKK